MRFAGHAVSAWPIQEINRVLESETLITLLRKKILILLILVLPPCRQ